MKPAIAYNENLTFVIATSEGYKGTKTMTEQHVVKCVFIQSVDYTNSNNQAVRDADAICFPDPADEFIIASYDRLEGMYVLASLFGSSDAISWYRIDSVTVNRDHLLGNVIDNVECLLKKASTIPGVS